MITDINLESNKVSTNVYSYNNILSNCAKVDAIKTNKPIGVILLGFKLYYRALTPTVNHHVDGIQTLISLYSLFICNKISQASMGEGSHAMSQF